MSFLKGLQSYLVNLIQKLPNFLMIFKWLKKSTSWLSYLLQIIGQSFDLILQKFQS